MTQRRLEGKCPWCGHTTFKVVSYSPTHWHVYCEAEDCKTIIMDVKVGGPNTTATFDHANE